MTVELPKVGDEYVNTFDGKTRVVMRVDKRSGEIQIVMRRLDCISSSKEYPVSVEHWNKQFSFGSWKKK